MLSFAKMFVPCVVVKRAGLFSDSFNSLVGFFGFCVSNGTAWRCHVTFLEDI